MVIITQQNILYRKKELKVNNNKNNKELLLFTFNNKTMKRQIRKYPTQQEHQPQHQLHHQPQQQQHHHRRIITTNSNNNNNNNTKRKNHSISSLSSSFGKLKSSDHRINYGDDNKNVKDLTPFLPLSSSSSSSSSRSHRSTNSSISSRTSFSYMVSTLLILQGLWWIFDHGMSIIERHSMKQPKFPPTLPRHPRNSKKRKKPSSTTFGKDDPFTPSYLYNTNPMISYVGPSRIWNTNTTTTSTNNNNNKSSTSSSTSTSLPCTTMKDINDQEPFNQAFIDIPKDGFFYISSASIETKLLSSITIRIARNVANRKLLLLEKQQEQQQKQQLVLKSKNTISNNSTTTTTNDEENYYKKTIITSNTKTCLHRYKDKRARKYRSRNKDTSFLWTIVQEPTIRLVTRFFQGDDFSKSHDYNNDPSTTTTNIHQSNKLSSSSKTLNMFQEYIRNNDIREYASYIKSLSTNPKTFNPYHHNLYEDYIQDILNEYNFIGIMERLDESLIVMKFLLNLNIEDIFYLPYYTTSYIEQQQQYLQQQQQSATTTTTTTTTINPSKNEINIDVVNNNVQDVSSLSSQQQQQIQQQQIQQPNNNNIVKLQPYEYYPIKTCVKRNEYYNLYNITYELKKWIYTSLEFESFINPDVLLYQAINKSLDLTIESIGYTKFYKTLKEFKYYQTLISNQCLSKINTNANNNNTNTNFKNTTIRFPCSIDGIYQEETDCWKGDIGCGYQCLDQIK